MFLPLAGLFSAVTFGISYPFLAPMVRTPRQYPSGNRFMLWTLVDLHILPILALAGCTLLLIPPEMTAPWSLTLGSLAMLSWIRTKTGLLRIPLAALVIILGIATATNSVPQAAHLTTLAFAGLSPVALLWMAAFLWRFQQRRVPRIEPRPGTHRDPSLPPVLLLVFDELSLEALLNGDQIDADHFPNFARLASDSVWFRQATANHASTSRAVPTILTGRRLPDPATPSLLHRLAGTYDVAVVSGSILTDPWLQSLGGAAETFHYLGKRDILNRSPLRALQYHIQRLIKSGYPPPPLRGTLLRMLGSPYHIAIPEQIDRLCRTVATGRVVYGHVMLPHFPYLHGPDGRMRHDSADTKWTPGCDPDRVWENYRQQVEWTDRILGRILDRLHAAGLLEPCVLLVTSDHGVRIGTRQNLRTRIPFILHAPGLEPSVRTQSVQQIDIAPTIMDLLGQPVQEADFDGRSIVETIPSR